MLVIARLALPVLLRVRDCAALEVPRLCVLKLRVPAERLTAGPLPVPVRATVWGLLARLSVMVIEAVLIPGAVGANFTRIEHDVPWPNVAAQVLVWEKSEELLPVKLILLIVKLLLPVFVTNTLCAVLVVPRACVVKETLEGERPIWPAKPVPDKAAVWGLPGPLSVTLMAPERVPAAPGVKVTFIAQAAFAATALPQVFVWAKSLALAPDTAMLVISKGAVPELVSEMLCAELVVP